MTRRTQGLRRERTTFELAVLGVSLAATASVVVGLIVSGVMGAFAGADLVATVNDTGRRASGGSVYELTIRNRGGETAENVVVEVTAGEETRELEILSVSKGDHERATVIFPLGTTGPATARVLSYHQTTRG